MKVSALFSKTSRNVPADEQSKNAQLLIRAGYINKEMAGVYSYLPLGKRVLDKVTAIVKREMDAIGGQEILLPSLQSKELWEKTGRWDDKAVDIWFKTKLRSGSEVGLGWSHEEPLVELLKDYMTSYQDLPRLIYQVQTKFRNELRAKSGLLRGREFLMKDMYSFALNESQHQKLFNEVKQAYVRIFDQLGIGHQTFYTTADGGSFSTDYSYEFQTLDESGEDIIHLDRDQKIAINDEIFSDKVVSELGLNKKTLETVKASEVGNIFNLGTKYSNPLKLNYLSEINTTEPVVMGCYGLGISRTMGIIAELLADENGLVWPEAVAPYRVYLVRLGNNSSTTKAADELYNRLTRASVEVLYDDRDVHPGEKFADADLIGLPYRVVVSDKTISEKKAEIKTRTSKRVSLLTESEIVQTLTEKL